MIEPLQKPFPIGMGKDVVECRTADHREKRHAIDGDGCDPPRIAIEKRRQDDQHRYRRGDRDNAGEMDRHVREILGAAVSFPFCKRDTHADLSRLPVLKAHDIIVRCRSVKQALSLRRQEDYSRHMKWTIPNILTTLRLLAAPGVVLMFLYFTRPWADWFALILFVSAAVTDWFDGYLARSPGDGDPVPRGLRLGAAGIPG